MEAVRIWNQERVKAALNEWRTALVSEYYSLASSLCISVMDETWTVFRRYTRFREMHKSLKFKYPELAALEFPPKKLFGNRDERMVSERRSHLERYLRNLFRVMLYSFGSPLRADEDGVFRLSKFNVCEFSPFFKKGVFESSSHGTG
ncbi:Kinesin-like protein kif16b [Ameca splendens]|uniref:Kinesin-like protein kif16b n=1 Tax=Ameca splendens TaxID=208324 RepID=A0ABV0Y862_9TELE